MKDKEIPTFEEPIEVWRDKMRRKIWCDLAMDAVWIEPNPQSPIPAGINPLDKAEAAIARFDKLFPAPKQGKLL